MINIRDQGQIFRVDVDTIERIDAAGDYMCIQTGDNTLILRETMKDLEKRLDPRRFQRVHRSTIVNLDLVRQVKPHTNGECFLVLDSGRAGEGQPQLSRRRGAVRSLTGRRHGEGHRARRHLLQGRRTPPRRRPGIRTISASAANGARCSRSRRTIPRASPCCRRSRPTATISRRATAPFMINLRVDDLDGMIADLEAKGIAILGRQDEDYGRFAWILDPDGIKVELWQQIGPAHRNEPSSTTFAALHVPGRPGRAVQYLGRRQRAGGGRGGGQGARHGQPPGRRRARASAMASRCRSTSCFANARRIVDAVDLPLSVDFEGAYSTDPDEGAAQRRAARRDRRGRLQFRGPGDRRRGAPPARPAVRAGSQRSAARGRRRLLHQRPHRPVPQGQGA